MGAYIDPEQVQNWSDHFNGVNPHDQSYQNPARWSFASFSSFKNPFNNNNLPEIPSPPKYEETDIETGSFSKDWNSNYQSSRSQSAASDLYNNEKGKKPEDLEWDGPNDKGNPLNWPMWERWFGTLIPAMSCFIASFGASVYAPAVFSIQAEFHVTLTEALVGLSLYVIGMALGPTIAGPISETLGRRYVYLISVPISALFTVGVATSKSFSGILACRFFSAMWASPVFAVGAGTVADIWDFKNGNGGPFAGIIFLMMAFMGPSMGPLAGFHILADGKSWRWTMWTLLLLMLPLFILLLFAKETYKKTILVKRAKARGIELAPKPPPKESLKLLFTVTLFRPFAMLFLDPIVTFVSVYNAFCFAVLFAFFEAVPYVLRYTYKLNQAAIGTSFVSIGLGVLLAAITCMLFEAFYYLPRRREARFIGQDVAPELRLNAAIFGSVIFPIGLFIFAWTANAGNSHLVPLFGCVLFGWGVVAVFIATATYLVDIYDNLMSASALAANSILRYILATAFPLFTVQMYDELGVHWAGNLLALIALGLLPLPWILWKWGSVLRARSRYINPEN